MRIKFVWLMRGLTFESGRTHYISHFVLTVFFGLPLGLFGLGGGLGYKTNTMIDRILANSTAENSGDRT